MARLTHASHSHSRTLCVYQAGAQWPAQLAVASGTGDTLCLRVKLVVPLSPPHT